MLKRDTQRGVMLIEALIGILIFSIGILALIGMQAVAIKNTTDARYRSEAGFLATEVIGKMWSDIPNLAKYDKDYSSAYTPRDEWVTKVSKMLPGVDLAGATAPTVEHEPATNQITVRIWWQSPGESAPRKLEMVNRINGS
jgi:type IV pilus assembly protein PilV